MFLSKTVIKIINAVEKIIANNLVFFQRWIKTIIIIVDKQRLKKAILSPVRKIIISDITSNKMLKSNDNLELKFAIINANNNGNNLDI